jgi:hypothetical protein
MLILVAHDKTYKEDKKKWENQDYTEHTSLVNYPWEDVCAYVETSFMSLKREQAKLLGLLEGRKMTPRSPVQGTTATNTQQCP